MNTTKSTSNRDTYDAVETAIKLAKKISGTWERLASEKGIKPWQSETDSVLTDNDSPHSEEQIANQL